jgi:hypothetical protein
MTRDDPRFTSDGRAVGFADLTDESHESLPNQAGFQGASHFACVPDQEIPDLRGRVCDL